MVCAVARLFFEFPLCSFYRRHVALAPTSSDFPCEAIKDISVLANERRRTFMIDGNNGDAEILHMDWIIGKRFPAQECDGVTADRVVRTIGWSPAVKSTSKD